MTEQEIAEHMEKIRAMSRLEMARLWRFAPSGHPYFDNTLPLHQIFHDRFFKELGGFSPEISKQLGWGN